MGREQFFIIAVYVIITYLVLCVIPSAMPSSTCILTIPDIKVPPTVLRLTDATFYFDVFFLRRLRTEQSEKSRRQLISWIISIERFRQFKELLFNKSRQEVPTANTVFLKFTQKGDKQPMPLVGDFGSLVEEKETMIISSVSAPSVRLNAAVRPSITEAEVTRPRNKTALFTNQILFLPAAKPCRQRNDKGT